MDLDRRDKGALLWLAAVACGLFGFFGFAVAMPWTFSVMTVAEAASQCPGAIDPNWVAVECNHSHPSEWKYGLIQDYPVRYAAAWLQLVVGWGAFFALAKRMKRYE